VRTQVGEGDPQAWRGDFQRLRSGAEQFSAAGPRHDVQPLNVSGKCTAREMRKTVHVSTMSRLARWKHLDRFAGGQVVARQDDSHDLYHLGDLHGRLLITPNLESLLAGARPP